MRRALNPLATGLLVLSTLCSHGCGPGAEDPQGQAEVIETLERERDRHIEKIAAAEQAIRGVEQQIAIAAQSHPPGRLRQTLLETYAELERTHPRITENMLAQERLEEAYQALMDQGHGLETATDQGRGGDQEALARIEEKMRQAEKEMIDLKDQLYNATIASERMHDTIQAGLDRLRPHIELANQYKRLRLELNGYEQTLEQINDHLAQEPVRPLDEGVAEQPGPGTSAKPAAEHPEIAQARQELSGIEQRIADITGQQTAIFASRQEYAELDLRRRQTEVQLKQFAIDRDLVHRDVTILRAGLEERTKAYEGGRLDDDKQKERLEDEIRGYREHLAALEETLKDITGSWSETKLELDEITNALRVYVRLDGELSHASRDRSLAQLKLEVMTAAFGGDPGPASE